MGYEFCTAPIRCFLFPNKFSHPLEPEVLAGITNGTFVTSVWGLILDFGQELVFQLTINQLIFSTHCKLLTVH